MYLAMEKLTLNPEPVAAGSQSPEAYCIDVSGSQFIDKCQIRVFTKGIIGEKSSGNLRLNENERSERNFILCPIWSNAFI